jgi:hypothetical protein
MPFFVDLLLAEIKRDVPSADNMANLDQKVNRFIVEDYFDKIKELLMWSDIKNKPERICNANEKGCRLRLHTEPKVLDQKGAKRVHTVAHEHGGEISVVSLGGAMENAVRYFICLNSLLLHFNLYTFLEGRFLLAILPAMCS